MHVPTALRAYTSPMQDDWVYYLAIVELAYNTAKSVSTGFLPIELLYIQPHDMIWRLLSPNNDMHGMNDSAEDFLDQDQTRVEDAREAMRIAAKAQKRHYDNRHSGLHKLEVGDFVVLRLNLHPIAAVKTNKLSAQKLPPLRVLEVLSNIQAIRLELPETLKIHPVVSVQHFDKWLPDEFNRAPPGLPHIHRVPKSIFDKKVTRGGRVKYKVDFKGFGVAHTE